jgi:regulatory subunit for Cdc7p protein kinase
MAGRRVPLGNLPNATNSPFRGAAAAAAAAAAAPGTKRARQAGDRDLSYAQPPPAKKQIVEADDQDARRHAQLRKAGYNPPTGLRSKLEAAQREVRSNSRPSEKASKPSTDNLENIRQWQQHYKKVFPQIVFYYESIPEDVRQKISRQVQALGSVS